MSDTVVSTSQAMSTVATVAYAGGAAGAGGAGGSPGGAGGNGGNGGNGSPVGAAGARRGRRQGGPGTAGSRGGSDTSVTTNFGGAIFCSVGCNVTLTRCSLTSNMVQNQSGGAIFYTTNCTTELDGCSLSNNAAGSTAVPATTTTVTTTTATTPAAGTTPASTTTTSSTTATTATGATTTATAGTGTTATTTAATYASTLANGGAIAFDVSCKATLNNCTLTGNSAAADGGGLYCWYECTLDVNDSTFANNQTMGTLSAGGAIYAGGTWDDKVNAWHNGGQISVKGTQVTGNNAAFGGGLYWYSDDATVAVTDCTIRNNTAQYGGGLYWSDGAPTLSNCVIQGNTALGARYSVSGSTTTTIPSTPATGTTAATPAITTTITSTQKPDTDLGTGGGFVCWSSNALITDCFISGNNVYGSGGGVYFGGDPFTPKLQNCLVQGNTATTGGGGIASYWYTAPTISSCTVMGNSTSDPNDFTLGLGGGLFASYESDVTVLNSILWGNTATTGNQIALGSKNLPTYLDRPATMTVTYCDVQGGAAGVHVEQGATLNWQAGNISADPLFVSSYYLSQTASGQAKNSPAVDAGSTSAELASLSGFTTRTDNQADTGAVDLGFHSPAVGRYKLSVSVIGGHGTVQPLSGQYNGSQTVTLTAIPDPGYRVKQWTGTDSDPSWSCNTNVVSMSSLTDRYVTVEFEQDIVHNLLVPTDFATIDAAITAAGPRGTNIILSQGTYPVTDPAGIDFQGKAITLMSTNPTNPAVVAKTIIDCAGTEAAPVRAFHFHSGEGAGAVVEGITIRNGYVRGPLGAAGAIGVLQPSPYDALPTAIATPPRPRGQRGGDGVGDSFGGGILCENGSSPTFRNCVITNCIATGGHGGAGAVGQSTTTPNPSTWAYLPPGTTTNQTTNDGQWGGIGGLGSGNGRGGALACLTGSSPVLLNCTFTGNGAYGGFGGHGGDGGNSSGGRESWGGDGGEAQGDGQGGAVYCDSQSHPAVRSCTFTNNIARSGVPGVPGGPGTGTVLPTGYTPAGSGIPGSIMSFGLIGGGAVRRQPIGGRHQGFELHRQPGV